MHAVYTLFLVKDEDTTRNINMQKYMIVYICKVGCRHRFS